MSEIGTQNRCALCLRLLPLELLEPWPHKGQLLACRNEADCNMAAETNSVHGPLVSLASEAKSHKPKGS